VNPLPSIWDDPDQEIEVRFLKPVDCILHHISHSKKMIFVWNKAGLSEAEPREAETVICEACETEVVSLHLYKYPGADKKEGHFNKKKLVNKKRDLFF
jgi:hypothetical protein